MEVFMKCILLSVLLVLSIALPVAAQDTPTPDVATLEATPVETVAPTVEPVPTEAPAPEPEPPVDVTAIPTWFIVLAVVLVAGIVSVAWVGIVNAAKGAPPWVQEVILAALKSGVLELDKVAKGTENTIDDAGVAELRKRIAQLEAELIAMQKAQHVG
jgi:hypothetical protein